MCAFALGVLFVTTALAFFLALFVLFCFFNVCIINENELLQELVLDIFEEYAGHTGALDYSNYIKAVADHPVVVQFACGEGTERYGSGY